jgi:hypothetical protein
LGNWENGAFIFYDAGMRAFHPALAAVGRGGGKGGKGKYGGKGGGKWGGYGASHHSHTGGKGYEQESTKSQEELDLEAQLATVRAAKRTKTG